MPTPILTPGINAYSAYAGADPTPGTDIKLGPTTIRDKTSTAKLIAIAQDTKGQYDLNTQVAAYKELVREGNLPNNLKMHFDNNDLAKMTAHTMGFISSTTNDSDLRKTLNAKYTQAKQQFNSNPFDVASFSFITDFLSGAQAASKKGR